MAGSILPTFKSPDQSTATPLKILKPAAATLSTAQFFSALSVLVLVLVVTAVIMTQKPAYMAGEEGDLGVTSPMTPEDIPRAYTDEQMQEMQEGEAPSQGLAQLRLRASTSGKAAVALAAADPGGSSHADDTYVHVGSGGGQLRVARRGMQLLRARAAPRAGRGRGGVVRGQDVVVPLREAKTSMYPLMTLASAGNQPRNPHEGFSREQVASGAGDGVNVVPFSFGYKEGEEPLSEAARGMVDRGYMAEPVDVSGSSRWAMYGAVFLVLLGSILLIGFYLLPPGALEKVVNGTWTEEQRAQYPTQRAMRDDQGRSAGWTDGYHAPAGSAQMREVAQ